MYSDNISTSLKGLIIGLSGIEKCEKSVGGLTTTSQSSPVHTSTMSTIKSSPQFPTPTAEAVSMESPFEISSRIKCPKKGAKLVEPAGQLNRDFTGNLWSCSNSSNAYDSADAICNFSIEVTVTLLQDCVSRKILPMTPTLGRQCAM